MPACDKRSSLRRLVSRFWPGLNESVTATTATATFRAHVRHAHLSSSSSSCTKVNCSEISQGRHVALDSYQISVPQIVLHTMRNYLGVHISFSLAAEGFPRPALPLLRFLPYSCFFGLFAAVANCQPIWAYLWPVARGHPVAVGGESLQLLLTEIYSSVCFLFRVKMSNGKYGLGAIERRFKTPAKRWQNCQLP